MSFGWAFFLFVFVAIKRVRARVIFMYLPLCVLFLEKAKGMVCKILNTMVCGCILLWNI